MRAFAGQHSDAVPVKRTRQQKQAQLLQLREQLAGLKPTVAATVRESNGNWRRLPAKTNRSCLGEACGAWDFILSDGSTVQAFAKHRDCAPVTPFQACEFLATAHRCSNA